MGGQNFEIGYSPPLDDIHVLSTGELDLKPTYLCVDIVV
jgi:hypothetical protein